MSGHEDHIGQEWTDASARPADVLALIRARIDTVTIGQSVIWRLATYVTWQELRDNILDAEHEDGRHAEGKCPELCPRF